MEVANFKQTCAACPSQWEGKLKDGRMFYIRYRWGYLSVSISKEATDNLSDVFNDDAKEFGMNFGDAMDGVLSTNEMIEAISNKVVFTKITE